MQNIAVSAESGGGVEEKCHKIQTSKFSVTLPKVTFAALEKRSGHTKPVSSHSGLDQGLGTAAQMQSYRTEKQITAFFLFSIKNKCNYRCIVFYKKKTTFNRHLNQQLPRSEPLAKQNLTVAEPVRAWERVQDWPCSDWLGGSSCLIGC